MNTLILYSNASEDGYGPIAIIYHDYNPKTFDAAVIMYSEEYEEKHLSLHEFTDDYIIRKLKEDGFKFAIDYTFNSVGI